MTAIYRHAAEDAKDLVRGSFATTHQENAAFLAEVEEGSAMIPQGGRLYEAQITLRDGLLECNMDNFLQTVAGKPRQESLPQMRDFLLREAERGECLWLQVIAPHDDGLHTAMIYMGEAPIAMQLALV